MNPDFFKLTEMDFNLQNLLLQHMDKSLYVGNVVERDSTGRIKVQIEPLFEGLSTDDLPWIVASTSTNSVTIPKNGDLVLIEFRGSIYEGFYKSLFFSENLRDNLSIDDLSTGFELNFDMIKIFGNYDGSSYTLQTPTFTVNIDGASGKMSIEGPGMLEMISDFISLNAGAFPMLNAQTPCQFTGGPHVSTTPQILSG